jgi:hypothetical protein
MTNIEQIIEALEQAEDTGIEWWEVFDSKTEARNIIDRAKKEELEDHNIARLISFIEEEDFFTVTPQVSFIRCLKTLKRQINKDY